MRDLNGLLNDSVAIKVTRKIFMVVGIVFGLFVVSLALFLHLYAKWFWFNREEEASAAAGTNTGTTRRHRRFDFASSHLELYAPITSFRRSLNPKVLKTVPLVIFNPNDFKDGLECAVCLFNLTAGKKVRLLPKSNHGFHVDCINMWFQSHSTCTLCRNQISNLTQSSSSSPKLTLESIINSPRAKNSTFGVYSIEIPNFSTNVLFWGNQTQVNTLGSCLEEDRQCPVSSQSLSSSSSSSSPPASSSSLFSFSFSSTGNKPDRMLVIDIPKQIGEHEEPKSPMTTQLRSLKMG